MFRHGDRSPIYGFPTDRYTESDWPQDYGQLSIVSRVLGKGWGLERGREVGLRGGGGGVYHVKDISNSHSLIVIIYDHCMWTLQGIKLV